MSRLPWVTPALAEGLKIDIWRSFMDCAWITAHPEGIKAFFTIEAAKPTQRIYASILPFAAWPRSKKVFASEPRPHSLKDPKSLYQSSAGTSG